MAVVRQGVRLSPMELGPAQPADTTSGPAPAPVIDYYTTPAQNTVAVTTTSTPGLQISGTTLALIALVLYLLFKD